MPQSYSVSVTIERVAKKRSLYEQSLTEGSVDIWWTLNIDSCWIAHLTKQTTCSGWIGLGGGGECIVVAPNFEMSCYHLVSVLFCALLYLQYLQHLQHWRGECTSHHHITPVRSSALSALVHCLRVDATAVAAAAGGLIQNKHGCCLKRYPNLMK